MNSTTLRESAPSTHLLPQAAMLSQPEVQRLLTDAERSGATLSEILRALESWSESIGYFDHLQESNERLEFAEPALGVNLRLQINYSRLGYKAPEGKGAPACPLCFENIAAPGKEKLRAWEAPIAGTPYFFHLTPFPLHPGHFVGNSRLHEPMRIALPALREASDFAMRCPGWLVASNSDVLWAGASVLGHHHIQIFRSLTLPVESAHPHATVRTTGDVRAALLQWPCPVARIEGDSSTAVDRAARIIRLWKDTAPGSATCNYLLRRTGPSELQIHLFLRHPAFRTPHSLQWIKSEGVGIIEMAGEIIVPPIAGKSRTENIDFFKESGSMVARGIIGGNGPYCADRTREWFAWFLDGALSGLMEKA